jgi:ankyrin repeat protein
MPLPSPTARLFAAIEACNLPAVSAATRDGACINNENKDYNTPLEAAVLSGSIDVVTILLQAGAVIRSEAALWRTAIDGGNLDFLRQILELISKEECVGTEGSHSPLMHAANRARPDMCRLLLERGANPKLSTANYPRGLNAVDYALSDSLRYRSSKSVFEVVKLLIVSGAQVGKDFSPHGQSPLIRLALEVCLEDEQFVKGLPSKLCKLLIRHGAPAGELNSFGTALHRIAAIHKTSGGTFNFDPLLVPLLIKGGVDVNAKDRDGKAALRPASFLGNIELCRQLLAFGADPCATDDVGVSALHATKSTNVARLLLEFGADQSRYLAAPHPNSEVDAFLCSLRHLTKMESSVADAPSPSSRQRI